MYAVASQMGNIRRKIDSTGFRNAAITSCVSQTAVGAQADDGVNSSDTVLASSAVDIHDAQFLRLQSLAGYFLFCAMERLLLYK